MSRSSSQASRALVTGATGFVGHHLARLLLERGIEVHALVRSDAALREPLAGRVQQLVIPSTPGALATLVADLQPHVVFHLAAEGAAWPTGAGVHALVRANVEFGLEVLDGLRALDSTPVFVHALSYSGFSATGSPEPNTPYAASKLAFELMARSICADGRVVVRGAVLYDVYGPEDWRDKLIPDLVHGARHRSLITLSAGEQFVAPMFVHDVTEGLMSVGYASPAADLERTAIGPTDILTVREVVHEFEVANGVSLDLAWAARPLKAPPKAIARLPFPNPPGWAPRTSLADGLRRCLRGASEPLASAHL